MAKHPALKMSKQREQVWLKEASPEDFFDMIDLLKALYAKKVYTESHANKKYIQYDAEILMADYEKDKSKPREKDDELHSW